MTSCSDTNRFETIELPKDVSERVFAHFGMKGRGVDPFKTDGSFYNFMDEDDRDWCNSMTSNRDFMSYKAKADYVMGCPPPSMFSECLTHAMCLTEEVVLVTTLDRVFERSNVDAMADMGFTVREVFVLVTDARFPRTACHIAAVRFSKNAGRDAPVQFDKGTVSQPMLDMVI